MTNVILCMYMYVNDYSMYMSAACMYMNVRSISYKVLVYVVMQNIYVLDSMSLQFCSLTFVISADAKDGKDDHYG